MADATKYAPINGGTLMTDLRTHFSIFRTKRTVSCAYGFVFVFIAFSVFLAFSPSQNSASPWFTNIFTTSFSSSSRNSSTSSSSIFSDESYRSHFSSVFAYFFPNSSTHVQNISPQPSSISIARSPNSTTGKTELNDKAANSKPNQSTILPSKSPKVLNNNTNKTVNKSAPEKASPETSKGSSVLNNQTQTAELSSKAEVLKANQSTVGITESSVANSQTENSPLNPPSGETTVKINDQKSFPEKGVVKNFTSSLSKKESSNGTNSAGSAEEGIKNMVKALVNCNLYDGNWVKDESYPLYKPGSCSLIDEQFNCFRNGRPDHDYYKLKWKPKSCTLPRLNATHMLELLRGKRLVYVGDSLNRNMWESLVCILRNSVKDQKKVYEENGRVHFRGEASYSFLFEDYNFRVEFFASPFLVQQWEVADKTGTKKETLRLDLIGQSAEKYKKADFIIFNTGHWWTHEKTSLGKDYYQEGSHVYGELNVLEAFRKALTTWARWVDANVNPSKTHVMFRGYSASHFSGGQWNSGGQCDHETEPIKNETYLAPYPPKMSVLEKVLRNMKVHVSYLNITRMTDMRKDGHPSVYRKQSLSEEERRSPLRFQDCSHWCLPGVPDAWNELLYAELLVKQMQNHQQ